MTHVAAAGAPSPDLTIAEAFAPNPAPRRILVYAPLAYSTPHFETDLEIAQRHLDLGDEVDLVVCDAELSSCQLNPMREPLRCVQCVSRNLQGSAQLSRKVSVQNLLGALTPADRARLAEIPRLFADQPALRHYRFDNFDAGTAALSSIIDFVRSVDIDPQHYADLIQRTLTSSVSTFLALKRVLAAKTYDRVYIYNGRWSMVRSAVRACEALRVPYYTHERGSDFRKFALYRDALPHDKLAYRKRVHAAWENGRSDPEAQVAANAFFKGRRERVEKSWFSFVKQQEHGHLPADWSRSVHRIVFFTSSEFEFAAIGGEAIGRIYPNQVTAVRCIAPRLAHLAPDAHLWIRVHPNDNSPAAAQAWQDAVAGLTNVTLILPNATVDSYALLDGAGRILTVGSTMGIEATYWGKPAICADTSFYDGLDAQHEAANEDELLTLLTQAALPPKPRDHVLCYGYYMNTYGEAFHHFATEVISDYEFRSPFRGRCLKPDYDDLHRRLLALYQQGELPRALAISELCANFKADDSLAHSIRVLCLVRLDTLASALRALEYAAAHSTPPQFEAVLKNTGKALVDATLELSKNAPAPDFSTAAASLAAALRRVPAFAGIAQTLAAMAARSAPGRAA